MASTLLIPTRALFALAAALLVPTPAPAQTAPLPDTAPTGDPPITTLHVYTNLQQLPTLVLNSLRQRIKHVDTARFRLSLDGGPLFKPTHVRVEGEEAVTLALFLDLTVPHTDLLPALSKALAPLGTGFLRPGDHVALYASDCQKTWSTIHLPGDPARLAEAVNTLIASRIKTSPPPCKSGIPLWDTLAYVSRQLGRQPGWRVLLAITNGTDSGSKTTWQQARDAAQENSVAIIGLLTTDDHASTSVHRPDYLTNSLAFSPGVQDPFDQVCELSGGIELASTQYSLGSTLKRIATMVRERYIIEFPRGNDTEAGIHDIEVSLLKTNPRNVYIRPTGIVAPLADPNLLADPSTVPSDPTRAPTFGKRKPLPSSKP